MSSTNYDRLIVKVLLEAGDNGLTVRKITRHVYNAVNGLFEEADMEAVHRSVWVFLQRHSQGERAALERPKRGTYSLNSNTVAGRMLLDTTFSESMPNAEKPVDYSSLPLFREYVPYDDELG